MFAGWILDRGDGAWSERRQMVSKRGRSRTDHNVRNANSDSATQPEDRRLARVSSAGDGDAGVFALQSEYSRQDFVWSIQRFRICGDFGGRMQKPRAQYWTVGTHRLADHRTHVHSW